MPAPGRRKRADRRPVYQDIEKYRFKNKLVEPSGSRSDRPSLLNMLKDASRGEFDIILAWREDRLYRGLRSMLMVLDAVQKYKLNILLAKETFDAKIAPLRAWQFPKERGIFSSLTGESNRKVPPFSGRLLQVGEYRLRKNIFNLFDHQYRSH